MPVRILPKELSFKATSELNEDSDRIQEDLKHIKEWADKQPHLNIRTDDQWLIGMLRGNKFSLEQTKQKLDVLCTMKTLMPEFFGNRDPFLPEIQEILNLGLMLPLPKISDAAAPRILLGRLNKSDPSRMKIENGIKVALMILDILIMEDDNFVISGNHIFLDDKATTANHVLQITPTLIKKTQTLIMEGYALRYKGFHAINVHGFVLASYNMFKSLLDSKLVELVHIYKNDDSESLYKAIPLSILPKEYGGSGGTLEELTRVWKAKVESYRDWFLEDSQYCSDESKRPGKPKTSADLFGSEGSFRKLEFD